MFVIGVSCIVYSCVLLVLCLLHDFGILVAIRRLFIMFCGMFDFTRCLVWLFCLLLFHCCLGVGLGSVGLFNVYFLLVYGVVLIVFDCIDFSLFFIATISLR